MQLFTKMTKPTYYFSIEIQKVSIFMISENLKKEKWNL